MAEIGGTFLPKRFPKNQEPFPKRFPFIRRSVLAPTRCSGPPNSVLSTIFFHRKGVLFTRKWMSHMCARGVGVRARRRARARMGYTSIRVSGRFVCTLEKRYGVLLRRGGEASRLVCFPSTPSSFLGFRTRIFPESLFCRALEFEAFSRLLFLPLVAFLRAKILWLDAVRRCTGSWGRSGGPAAEL